MSAGRRRFILFLFILAALFFTLSALLQGAAHRRLPFSCAAECRPLSLFVREERLPAGRKHTLPPLQNGDILLTTCTHSFGWRHGHAALVVDSRTGTTLEAVTPGTPSSLGRVPDWETYPSLTVLRLKHADKEIGQAVADFAQETLLGLPYCLTSGWGRSKSPSPPTGSQCAYLVWYAYFQFGYDLDSDGGKLVTVADLAASPLLETVFQSG